MDRTAKVTFVTSTGSETQISLHLEPEDDSQ